MKVLLIKDVYKLGRAGDIKKVADGYGRNYLIPQRMAILATPGAQKMAESIRAKADERRTVLNEEMAVVAESLKDLVLTFISKAGDTGKLYGSITTEMIAEEIKARTGQPIDRHQIVTQSIRTVGEHVAKIHLTVDLTPEIKVIVTREGEVEAEEVKGKGGKPAKKAASKEAEAVVAEETPAEVKTEEAPADATPEAVDEAAHEAVVEETPSESAAEETPEAETSEGAEPDEGTEKAE
jgi:large subunit ribosomal protein L9